MTNLSFNLSSLPKHGSAEWILKHHRSGLEYLTCVLCTPCTERDAEWFDFLDWQGWDANEAYRACCHLLAEGFDPKRYWDELNGVYEAKVPYPSQPKQRLSDEEIFEMVLSHIERNGIDITADRTDWLAIGSALKCTFGDRGLDYWKRLSKYYDCYSDREAETQWRSLARHGNYSLGVIYSVCRKYGISVKDIIKNRL